MTDVELISMITHPHTCHSDVAGLPWNFIDSTPCWHLRAQAGTFAATGQMGVRALQCRPTQPGGVLMGLHSWRPYMPATTRATPSTAESLRLVGGVVVMKTVCLR